MPFNPVTHRWEPYPDGPAANDPFRAASIGSMIDRPTFDQRVTAERRAAVDTTISARLEQNPVASLLRDEPGAVNRPGAEGLLPGIDNAVGEAVSAGARALESPTASTTRRIVTPASTISPAGQGPSPASQAPPEPTLEEMANRVALRTASRLAAAENRPVSPEKAAMRSLGVGALRSGLIPGQVKVLAKVVNKESMTAGEVKDARKAVASIDPTSMGDRAFKTKMATELVEIDTQIDAAREAVNKAVVAADPQTVEEYKAAVTAALSDGQFPLAAHTVANEYQSVPKNVAELDKYQKRLGIKARSDIEIKEAERLDAASRELRDREVLNGVPPAEAEAKRQRIIDGTATDSERAEAATVAAQEGATPSLSERQGQTGARGRAASGTLDLSKKADQKLMIAEGRAQEEFDALKPKQDYSGELPTAVLNTQDGNTLADLAQSAARGTKSGTSLESAVGTLVDGLIDGGQLEDKGNAAAYYKHEIYVMAQEVIRQNLGAFGEELQGEIDEANDAFKVIAKTAGDAVKGGLQNKAIKQMVRKAGETSGDVGNIDLDDVATDHAVEVLTRGRPLSESEEDTFRSAVSIWESGSATTEMERRKYGAIFDVLDSARAVARAQQADIADAESTLFETERAKDAVEGVRRQQVEQGNSEIGVHTGWIEPEDAAQAGVDGVNTAVQVRFTDPLKLREFNDSSPGRKVAMWKTAEAEETRSLRVASAQEDRRSKGLDEQTRVIDGLDSGIVYIYSEDGGLFGGDETPEAVDLDSVEDDVEMLKSARKAWGRRAAEAGLLAEQIKPAFAAFDSAIKEAEKESGTSGTGLQDWVEKLFAGSGGEGERPKLKKPEAFRTPTPEGASYKLPDGRIVVIPADRKELVDELPAGSEAL